MLLNSFLSEIRATIIMFTLHFSHSALMPQLLLKSILRNSVAVEIEPSGKLPKWWTSGHKGGRLKPKAA